VTVDVDQRTHLGSLEKFDSVLLPHSDATMGIRMTREKPRVETDCRLKLQVVSHGRLHEFQPGRDLHVFISVWNNNLFRRRVAKETVKARRMVQIFIRDPEVAGRRFVARPPGTDGRPENHSTVVRQIGFLVGQINLNSALGETADRPPKKDHGKN
jgi:hypothetical protein